MCIQTSADRSTMHATIRCLCLNGYRLSVQTKTSPANVLVTRVVEFEGNHDTGRHREWADYDSTQWPPARLGFGVVRFVFPKQLVTRTCVCLKIRCWRWRMKICAYQQKMVLRATSPTIIHNTYPAEFESILQASGNV